MKKNLVLLGMMAAGKTTLAKIVAKKLNCNFIDTDEVIVKNNSMSIIDIFKNKGESFFRTEEEKEVLKAVKKINSIISIGGGAFLNKKIRDNVLQNAISIWLNVDIETLQNRIKRNDKRPLLNVENYKAKLKELYLERKKIYLLADYKIDCGKLKKDVLVKKIIKLYSNE